MSLDAQLWREVSRHLEIDESVRRIAPLLARHLPLELVIVRRLDRDPTRLTTVALGPTRRADHHPTSARTDCDAAAAAELRKWASAGKIVRLGDREGPASLRRSLVPPGVAGTVLAGPLTAHGEPVGVVVLVASASRRLDVQHVALAQAVLEPLSVALENDHRVHELARMREALEADRAALLSRLQRQDIAEVVIGESGGLRAVMERVEQVAPTDAPVLILGDTGSGKEVIARAIHARSARAKGPIVRVNCGAIPAELIDSELFGHERGSFTGAVATRKGWFERADGGTLFLDEVGELPPAAQVRLLRVLQDGTMERVGGHQAITVDVRIVAATNRHLETMVSDASFREDLWYRISVFPIRLPSLRERPEDIPSLAKHFAQRAGLRLGGTPLVPSAGDVELLRGYAWPGNVRELAAVIERAAILGDGKRLELAKALGASMPGPAAQPMRTSALPPAPRAPEARADASDITRLDAAMVAHIERALAASHGRIEGPFGAARALGVNPHTLRARMRRLGVDWARFRHAAD